MSAQTELEAIIPANSGPAVGSEIGSAQPTVRSDGTVFGLPRPCQPNRAGWRMPTEPAIRQEGVEEPEEGQTQTGQVAGQAARRRRDAARKATTTVAKNHWWSSSRTGSQADGEDGSRQRLPDQAIRSAGSRNAGRYRKVSRYRSNLRKPIKDGRVSWWWDGSIVLQPSHWEMANGSSMNETLHETISILGAARHHRFEPSSSSLRHSESPAHKRCNRLASKRQHNSFVCSEL